MTEEVTMLKSYVLIAGLVGALAAGLPALAQNNGKQSAPDRSAADMQRENQMHGHDMMGGMMNAMAGGCMQMMSGMGGRSGGRPNEQWRQPDSSQDHG
jgi:hypothetical protein